MNKVEKVIDVINQSNGRFCSVVFIKKNGKPRHMLFRKGVRKNLSNTGLKHNPEDFGHSIVYEVNNGYRTINCNTVTKLKANHKTYAWSK